MATELNVRAEREQLLAEIRAHAEPEYGQGAARVMRTGLPIYGVRVPQLRAIAREWQRAHPAVTDEAFLELVERLWQGDSQEERALAIELLCRYPRRVAGLPWDHFDRWRYGLDNWGLTDGLATGVLGRWLLADPAARLSHLRELIADDHLWSRRLALVATVPLNRGHTGITFPELTLELIDAVKHERHPMITKAVSWALREMIRHHPDRVAAYLEDNRGALSANVVREVTNKLQTGLKRGNRS